MDKTVSIIIPAYNAENTLGKCIDSVLNQTRQPDEVIIIDDGSIDSTFELANQYKQKKQIIKVIHQDNAGVSVARNAGLDLATGECILFIDSDDYIGINYVETIMRYSDYDFVTCGFFLQNADLEWKTIRFDDEAQMIDQVRKCPSKYMGKYYFGSPWAKLYKRQIIADTQLRFNTQIHNGEDIIFNFTYILASTNLRIVSQNEYYYCYQKKSLSHSQNPDTWKWVIGQEEAINQFFSDLSGKEKHYWNKREFMILKRTLESFGKYISRESIREFSNHPLFTESIEFTKKTGSSEDKLLIFCLRHNCFNIYSRYLLFKKYSNRAINHFKRKLLKYQKDTRFTGND